MTARVELWLKAPVQMPDGSVMQPDKGTPQGDARRGHHAMDAKDNFGRRERFAGIRAGGTALRFRRLIAWRWESNGEW
jgi:hypothetical protein